MSGAQWSPDLLNELADNAERKRGMPITADALRAFASVVSVLMLDMRVVPTIDQYRASLREHVGTGDSPLAAIIALADALETSDG